MTCNLTDRNFTSLPKDLSNMSLDKQGSRSPRELRHICGEVGLYITLVVPVEVKVRTGQVNENLLRDLTGFILKYVCDNSNSC